MIRTVIGTLADSAFASRYAEPLFRLRYRVFFERLHWDVRCQDEMETDEYDDLRTRYVVAVDDGDQVLGGWRLRPTVGNYMLADVFPQLLYGTPAPHHPRVWESNRFVVDRGRFFPLHSAYYLIPKGDIDPDFLVAVLNSRVSEFLIRLLAPVVKDGFSRYRRQFLATLPIPYLAMTNQ